MKLNKHLFSGRVIKRLKLLLLIGLLGVSCKKMIEVPVPITNVTTASVYSNDATAASVLTDIYANMSYLNADLSGESLVSITLLGALCADELALFDTNRESLRRYYTNDLINNTNPSFWNAIYPVIFIVNAAIEGLNNSQSLTPSVKKQLLGEAKFIRAFHYFYLTNLYGDVPLPISSNYKVNAVLSRSPQQKLYDQIIMDLQDSQALLSERYLAADVVTPTQERVRPTKWAATALLSRVYLYTKNFKKAEEEATKIIDHTSLYSLVSLNEVFLKNSSEAIWQLQSVGLFEGSNTGEGAIFILPEGGPNTNYNPVYLNPDLVKIYEAGDQRRASWIDSVNVDGQIYYYPFKYKIGRVNTPTMEYPMVLRLAEQYLIRAEARLQQNNLVAGTSDLNIIRRRAKLPDLTFSGITDLLEFTMQERRRELFTEWGHRWLDLKRTQTVDAIMTHSTAQKGGDWKSSAQLFPLPLSDLLADPNLIQNPGY